VAAGPGKPITGVTAMSTAVKRRGSVLILARPPPTGKRNEHGKDAGVGPTAGRWPLHLIFAPRQHGATSYRPPHSCPSVPQKHPSPGAQLA